MRVAGISHRFSVTGQASAHRTNLRLIETNRLLRTRRAEIANRG
jgi:hypothetical protein